MRHQIPVSLLEFDDGGKTLWVHNANGETVLRIKTGGLSVSDVCANTCAHADIRTPDKVEFCIPKGEEEKPHENVFNPGKELTFVEAAMWVEKYGSTRGLQQKLQVNNDDWYIGDYVGLITKAYRYRVAPAKAEKKTIVVNGVTVNAPLETAKDFDRIFYLGYYGKPNVITYKEDRDVFMLKMGLIFATKEDAEAYRDAVMKGAE